MNRYFRLLGSKTVIGATGTALSWLATLPVVDVKHVVGAAGAVLTAAGVRDALHKVTDAVAGTKV